MGIHPVRRTLREQGRHQRWLAQQIGIPDYTLSRWLDKNTIPDRLYQQIARILKVRQRDIRPQEAPSEAAA